MRTTLADWFTEFAYLPDPYLLYDNGYRSWSYTYSQLGAAARTFAGRLQTQGIGKGGESDLEIVFTSGATGDPRGVRITLRDILSNLVSPERLISKYVKWFRPHVGWRSIPMILGLTPGKIIVMHDGHHIDPRADRRYTLEAAGRIIDELRGQGYSFAIVCGGESR